MEGWPTPEDAALNTMPRAITHFVETRYAPGGWRSTSSAGGGFTDRTLADLRANPPMPER